MKIYTRKGDDGATSLYGGGRVRKDSTRIEAYGTVDELNAQLGVVRSQSPHPSLADLLEELQNDLFTLGADLATPQSSGAQNVQRIGGQDAERLERHIDSLDAHLKPLTAFILPGGSNVAAALHVARTVCRRAERLVVRLGNEEPVGGAAVVYLNRLSDLLFVMARYANHVDRAPETEWKPAR
jgi:cob(I)alamin adenosyltransferase